MLDLLNGRRNNEGMPPSPAPLYAASAYRRAANIPDIRMCSGV
jgi:hypothetical protein